MVIAAELGYCSSNSNGILKKIKSVVVVVVQEKLIIWCRNELDSCNYVSFQLCGIKLWVSDSYLTRKICIFLYLVGNRMCTASLESDVFVDIQRNVLDMLSFLWELHFCIKQTKAGRHQGWVLDPASWKHTKLECQITLHTKSGFVWCCNDGNNEFPTGKIHLNGLLCRKNNSDNNFITQVANLTS